MMQPRLLTRLPSPYEKQSQRSDDRRDEQQESRSDELGDAHDDSRRKRQLLCAEGRIEVAELRHDPQHDDRYYGERQRRQDGGGYERRERFPFDGRDDFRILDITPENRI